MKDSKKRRFYLKLVSLVFVTILVTYLILTITFVIFEKLKYITIGSSLHWQPWVILLLFMLGALFLGLIIAFFMANIFLRPITELSDATKRVAKGDFNVQIQTDADENSEMGELILNFNKMVKDLQHIETLKNDFVVNVSHEFKTPLATIQGYSTLLQDENLLPSERESYTRYIIDATKQLSNLTSNILKLSKLENREIDVEKTHFDAAEQIRQALLFLETQWSVKNIDLDIDLYPGEIYANEELTMQIWLNIIGNAIKFSDYAGKISVCSSIESGMYTVSFKDNGCGMSEETKERIFEKFYQGDNSHSNDGNGLGMALVKKIIDISGGEIFVESQKGKGTEFTVKMPVYKN